MFQMANGALLEGVVISGATGVSGVGVSVPTGVASCQVHGSRVRKCTTGFLCTGPNTVGLFQKCFAENIDAVNPVGIGFRATAGGIMGMAICATNGDIATVTPVGVGFQADGNDGASTGSQIFSGVVSAQIITTGFNCFGSSGITSLIRLTGGEIVVALSNGVDIGTDATVELYGVSITGSVGNDVRLTTSSSKFIGLGNKIRSDRIRIDNVGAQIIGASLSETPGDNAVSIRGEFHVGSVDEPSESAFGGGDSHTRGMTVFRTNAAESLFTNITTDVLLPDDGNTASVDLSTIGDKIYIGGSFAAFPGIKIIVDTGLASGTVAWEYWDGSAWVEYRIMSSQTNSPYVPFNMTSLGTGNFQYRFGDIVNPKVPLKPGMVFQSSTSPWVTSASANSAWSSVVVNRVTSFWVRIRVVIAILPNPLVLDQIKLHTNRTEINGDAWMEYFGSGRSVSCISGLSLGSINLVGIDAPTDVNISSADNLRIGRIENVFPNATTSRIGWAFELGSDVDTSYPLIFEWRWFRIAGNTQNVRWVVRWGYTRDVDLDAGAVSNIFTDSNGPATGGNEQEIQTTQSVGGVNKQVSAYVNIDISGVRQPNFTTTGDLLWITLERAGSATGDNFNNTAYLAFVSGKWLIWNNGHFTD